jgi:hypothetical protein
MHPMLAEIFLMKLESKIRTERPRQPGTPDPRFVPIAPPRS